MSIQANVNQMISVMGLLISQTSAAETRKSQKKVETEKPLREAELALTKAKSAATHEERLLAEQKERETKTAEAKKFYETQASAVKELNRTRSGEIHKQTGSGEWLARISEREGAIEAGEALRKLSPSVELESALGTWKTELNQLQILQNEKDVAARLQGRKAAKKQVKEDEANESAEQAKTAEQKRILFSPPTNLYNEPDPAESIRRAGSWYK